MGKLLPSFHAANMGWSVIGGSPVDPLDSIVLAGWTVAFAGLAGWRFLASDPRPDDAPG